MPFEEHSVISFLNRHEVILASSSPRRSEIFSKIGLKFKVVPSEFLEENIDKTRFSSPEEYTAHLALEKARKVCNRVKNNRAIIISADTVVAGNGKIYEKPKNEQDSIQTLSELSGKEHVVHTSVGIICPKRILADGAPDGFVESIFSEKTTVQMFPLSNQDIKAYVKTGIPSDKAGSYAYQNEGGLLVSSINGCYYNILGFPIGRFVSKFSELMNGFER